MRPEDDLPFLNQSEVLKRVRAEASRQIADEAFAVLVAEEKRRILERRSLWHRLFPWRITITRR